jgi:hypothetical protein
VKIALLVNSATLISAKGRSVKVDLGERIALEISAVTLGYTVVTKDNASLRSI